MLHGTSYLGAKSAAFPMEQNIKLSQDDGELLYDPTVFQRLIGRLLSDHHNDKLTYLVHRQIQYMAKPRVPHFIAAYRVLL